MQQAANVGCSGEQNLEMWRKAKGRMQGEQMAEEEERIEIRKNYGC